MGKRYVTAAAALALGLAFISSCKEFEPVFTGSYDSYVKETIFSDASFKAAYPSCEQISIEQLKKKYESALAPVDIYDDIYVSGQVVSSDSTGNFYKSIFIQDATTGIELKLGKYNLCNEYKPNQWVYVRLQGLTVGAYYGSVQIGYKDESGSYETAYIEVQRLIDTHVLRGEMGPEVQPKELSASDLTGWKSRCCGTLVTLKGMTYANEIFCLLYRNPNLPSSLRDKNHAWERVFLSDEPCGVTTWAMSERKFTEYLSSGIWDSKTQASAEVGASGVKTVKQMREGGEFVASAYTVSQYFSFKGNNIGVRTSGYAKFCDEEIPAEILSGTPVDMTGVITYYDSSSEFQFTLRSLDDIQISK